VPGAERRSRDRRRRDMAGRPFTFVKFRTMYVDARQRFPELYRYRYTEEEIRTMKFKLDPDPRLTRVGRVLRKTSLDELPNLWNVLTGGIALVGPRPEIPEMTPYYTEQQRLKFRVRPGVTGLAQIHGRGRLTFQETVGWDVEYVRRRSLGADVSILWQTAIAVMRRDGAF
jgi:lipopolysaccharide/colanic/teichoic acid biosynthesis glycosyltransferase